jgi:hypothetical protein
MRPSPTDFATIDLTLTLKRSTDLGGQQVIYALPLQPLPAFAMAPHRC